MIVNKPTRVTENNATLNDNIITNSFTDQDWKTGILKTDISDHLKSDIETNPGTRGKYSQYFSFCHWNLNSFLAHSFEKVSLLFTSI